MLCIFSLEEILQTVGWKNLSKLSAEKLSANYRLKNRLTILEWEVAVKTISYESLYIHFSGEKLLNAIEIMGF